MENISLHSIRVAYENWLDASRFTSLLDLLRKFDTGITSVSLFTSSVHTPLTLTETKKRAEIIRRRITEAKEAGFSCGINVLATIGHHHEDLENTPAIFYRTMVNAYGDSCQGTVCMNNEEYFTEYISQIYRIYSSLHPDHIWIDDDIRYGHMPIGNGCFCDKCIEKFNTGYGYDYDRESLRFALEEENVTLRLDWLAFRSETISNLLREIGRTVREVDENIMLGFMTGERYTEGYDFAGYTDALSDGGKYSVMWRPGGGAYTDRTFDDIVQKAEQIGRQNAFLPQYVSASRSEVENFPYNMIKKTPLSTAAEAFLGIMSGCTGAAFNILPSETLEPLETAAHHLKAIADIRPICERLVRETSSLVPYGIHTGWKTSSQAALPNGQFINGYGGSYSEYNRELFSFGLPESWCEENSPVCTLTGRCASVMTDDEIQSLLCRGIYLDVHALRDLTERGFGKYLGFSVGDIIPVDARESYTLDQLNVGFENSIRNCRQAFNGGDSFAIKPNSTDARILSRLVDYHENELAPCVSGIYENSLGGRVFVSGYYPYSWISDYHKTIQLKRILVWLSKNDLPAYVDSYCRIRCSAWSSNDTNDFRCAVLFNTSNDFLHDVRLCVRAQNRSYTVYDYYDRKQKINAEQQGEYSVLTISNLAPYQGVVVTI